MGCEYARQPPGLHHITAINTEPGHKPGSNFVALRGAPTLSSVGRFGALPTPEPAKRSELNTVIFGSVIAIAYCNLVGGTLRRVGLVG